MNRRDFCIGLAAGAGQSLAISGTAGGAVRTLDGPQNPADLGLAEASREIRAGRLSCVDLVQACLQRIEARNPTTNAIITSMREPALAQAESLDAEARSGKFRSALHGIPIALKDNIDTANAPTTNASALRKDYVPRADARVVQSLKQAGAIIIAKANMSEFALASATSATSHYGPVRNPWKPDHVSGGSSGGSAAAVAAGMSLGALGTDSGGSVRIPSAWCGLVGLKPTSGLVPTTGVGPGLPAIDVTGPIARTVEDVALMLDHMAGYDPLDVMSAARPRENYAASLSRPVSRLRVGVPRRPFFEDLDDQVARAVEAALGVLAKLVASVSDVEFKGSEFPADTSFATGDIVNYHAQFYPKQAQAYQPLTRHVLKSLFDHYADPATGSAADKVASYINSAADVARRQRTIDATFDTFDVVVMPTMREVAPTVKAAVATETGPSPFSLGSKINTMTFNLLGLPALSVPCGFSKEGLPIALMIGGPRFSEGTLLALGAAYQRVTSWHERRPG